MNFSGLFILRPVMTTLLMLGVLLFGLLAYFSLPIDDLPAVDFPTITVSAGLPGASPETMASAVATPLEKQFSNIAGLESMNSTSQLGSSSITLQFDLNRKIDGAAEDTQAAIVAARAMLPTSMPTPPTFKKVNPADVPIMFIALSSESLPIYQVDEYAENMLAPRLSMTNGVAQVQVFGPQVYAPHVQIDPRKLASMGIGVDEVAGALRQGNVNLPVGTLYGPDKAYNLKVNSQLYNADQFKKLIVTYKNGAPIRLEDIGTVVDSVQTDKVATWHNGDRAIVLAVQKQANTNTIEIADSIERLLPSFQAAMPPAMHLQILYDRSITIRRSVEDVQRTLLITIVLVIFVIYFFLGNVSSTVIASLSLPISIFGTLACMKILGFTLNNISLMAITLCVGFVVDDAIVVLENIVRHVDEGIPVFKAALQGAQEIGFTIVAMTFSLVAVFIPIMLMGGVVGRLFFQFAVTISIAIVISGIVSLSLTPMLCSRFLKPHREEKASLFTRFAESQIRLWTGIYEHSLLWSLKNKDVIVAMFLLTILATGILIRAVPKGFIPSEDRGIIMGIVQAQEGISFKDMVAHQEAIADIVSACSDVRDYMSSIGTGQAGTSNNQGRLNLFLKPLTERKLKADEIISSLRKKSASIPGVKYFLQNPPGLRIGGQMTKALYQVTISGQDIQELYSAAKKLEHKVKEIPSIVDLNSDLQVKNLTLKVDINRDKCSNLGLSLQKVQDALNNAYASRQVSTIFTEQNQYWVILEVKPEYYEDPSMLDWLRIRSSSGQLIPLSTVAKVSRGVGPVQINHLGQLPSVTLSFNLKEGSPLSEAVEGIKEAAQKTLPADISLSFEGTAQAFESSTKDMGLLLILAVLVIYIVLGILYESFIHPLTILSGLPSAGLGALITLMLFHKDLDIYGFLGMILLLGIVKKNAIMMIDFAVEAQRSESLEPEAAITKACLVRFRPIMMTTLAALLGSLPIALAAGQGSETRQPLGLTIVGGLLLSQLVTLYITPVFYIYLDRLEKFMIKRKQRKTMLKGTL
ncbi:MAG: efflux RND transporter permease subunit [Candidatus Obscuribacterales bacterium]|nr:efflux RND transporter permease subunit [Candidatus Obscuribacterales bacterium]